MNSSPQKHRVEEKRLGFHRQVKLPHGKLLNVWSLALVCFIYVGMMAFGVMAQLNPDLEPDLPDSAPTITSETQTDTNVGEKGDTRKKPSETTSPGYSVNIVSEGLAVSSITVTDSKDIVVQFAAEELQHYIEKISGAKIPLSSEGDAKKGGVTIILDKGQIEDSLPDAFIIDVTREKITLTGTNSRGVLYAVYSLLEQLGCAWMYPGEAEEIVPKLATVAIPGGSRTEKPALEHRGLTLYCLFTDTIELGRDIIDWMAKNRLNLLLTSHDRDEPHWETTDTQFMRWSEVGEELLPEVLKRGFVLEMSEHSTGAFFPRSLFNEHPKWFSLIDGVRKDLQMCYSNQEAVDYYVKKQVEYVKKHPEIDILGTWPLDGGGYCQCPECAKPDVIFNMVVKVANAVEKIRPDLIVEHLAYKRQTFPVPTTVKIPDNVSVLVCGRTDDLAREWAKATRDKGGAYLFEYEIGNNYTRRANIWLDPAHAKKTTRAAIDVGYRGLISLFLPTRNWWRASFNSYFFARTSWDPDVDLVDELEKYCASYYGDQSQQAFAIFDLILNKMQGEKVRDSMSSRRNRRRRRGGGGETPIDRTPIQEVNEAATQILGLIAIAQRESTDDAVIERFRRVKSYVEYFQIYTRFSIERGEEKIKALDELKAHSDAHPNDKDGVCVRSDFIELMIGGWARRSR